MDTPDRHPQMRSVQALRSLLADVQRYSVHVDVARRQREIDEYVRSARRVLEEATGTLTVVEWRSCQEALSEMVCEARNRNYELLCAPDLPSRAGRIELDRRHACLPEITRIVSELHHLLRREC